MKKPKRKKVVRVTMWGIVKPNGELIMESMAKRKATTMYWHDVHEPQKWCHAVLDGWRCVKLRLEEI